MHINQNPLAPSRIIIDVASHISNFKSFNAMSNIPFIISYDEIINDFLMLLKNTSQQVGMPIKLVLEELKRQLNPYVNRYGLEVCATAYQLVNEFIVDFYRELSSVIHQNIGTGNQYFMYSVVDWVSMNPVLEMLYHEPYGETYDIRYIYNK